jgi:hypothetical protein
MQDGVTPHFTIDVHAYNFPGYFGRLGVHEWLPHRPDLTTCDFPMGAEQGASLLHKAKKPARMGGMSNHCAYLHSGKCAAISSSKPACLVKEVC